METLNRRMEPWPLTSSILTCSFGSALTFYHRNIAADNFSTSLVPPSVRSRPISAAQLVSNCCFSSVDIRDAGWGVGVVSGLNFMEFHLTAASCTLHISLEGWDYNNYVTIVTFSCYKIWLAKWRWSFSLKKRRRLAAASLKELSGPSLMMRE